MTQDTRERHAPRQEQDWMALWQSELAAMATDREMQENWGKIAGFWASRMAGMGYDPARQPGSAAPPGASPSAAASGPDMGEQIERLTARIAELEQRLARLEAG